MRFYGEFTKTERQPDGTIIVSGIASSDAVDSEGEVVTADAMRRAPPKYMHFPAVREQHDSTRAVGTGIAAEVDGEGKTHFEALIVDPVTIAKITSEPPVLRGFSIGGRVPAGGRDPNDPRIIRAIELVEVSLVDCPANPDARVTMWKADADSPEATWGPGATRFGGTTVDREPKPDPTPSSGEPDPDGVPKHGNTENDPHACPTCGGILKCQRCHATAADEPTKLAKISRVLDVVKSERDQALRKLGAVEAARDDAVRKLRAVEVRAAASEHERDAANRELSRRPKGALRDVTGYVTVEKADDLGGYLPAPEGEPDVRALIRKAHTAPRPIGGDGGPLMPRRRG